MKISYRDIISMVGLMEHTGLNKVWCTFRKYELVAKRTKSGISIQIA